MCSGDCLNDRNGIKTFRSDEGAYGWPRAGEVSLQQPKHACGGYHCPCLDDKPWQAADADHLPPLCFSWARSMTVTEPARAQFVVADRTVSCMSTIHWRVAHPIANAMASRTTGPLAATWSTDAPPRDHAAQEWLSRTPSLSQGLTLTTTTATSRSVPPSLQIRCLVYPCFQILFPLVINVHCSAGKRCQWLQRLSMG